MLWPGSRSYLGVPKLLLRIIFLALLFIGAGTTPLSLFLDADSARSGQPICSSQRPEHWCSILRVVTLFLAFFTFLLVPFLYLAFLFFIPKSEKLQAH